LISGVVAVIGSAALSGCGSSNASTVASVQGVAISRVSLTHRMSIENNRLQGAAASIPVPDPPRYRRCVAAAETAQGHLKRQRQLSRVELRRQCAKVYAELKDKALAYLITSDWLRAEAAAQGIVVPESEVDASYEGLVNGPAGQQFADRLRRAGMTRSDELLELRIERLTRELKTKIAARPQPQLNVFVAAFRQRWKQRTTCQPGYIISECRNGPPLPPSPRK
jgi:hypothetical protein